MKKIGLHAIVPISKLYITKEEFDNYQYCLFNYIKNLSNTLSYLDIDIISNTSSALNATDGTTVLFNVLNPRHRGFEKFYDFLRIEAEIKIDDVELHKLNPQSDFDELDYAAHAAVTFSLAIHDTLILSSIAFLGHLRSAFGQVFYKELLFNIINAVSGYSSEIFYKRYSLNWPKLELLDLESVIKWESKLGLFKNGLGNNSVQKSFASYTQILKLSSIDNFEMLFWAMQGLEGFYCNGKGELRNQLMEKSKLFLGKWEDKKNIIGHLYDLRSKFIHGDFPVERWNNEYRMNDKNEREYDKLFDGTNFALQILISTLQECIKQNIIDVEFSYKINKISGLMYSC
jgi:hypothetical protein